jgi:ABC-type dipeptide/oligopeptide/nickel transport system permease component
VVVITAGFVLVNFIVDTLHGVIDPRIGAQAAR